MRPLSQIESRRVDQLAIEEFGIPGIVLMENAGRGCAEIVTKNWAPGHVVICCGKGNNGGDGFVIARYLENAGWSVKVRLACPPEDVTGDAALFLAAVQKSGIDVGSVLASNEPGSALPSAISWGEFTTELSHADLVVDALLGSGLIGPTRTPYSDLIEAINSAGRPVLAVDLPSGLDCNTGKPLGSCIRATRTATLVTHKLGFDRRASQEFSGPIDVIEIGLPRVLVQQLDRRAPVSENDTPLL